MRVGSIQLWASIGALVVAAKRAAEPLEEPFPELRRGGRREIGPAAVSRVAVERELRDREDRAADIGERPLHPAALLEDAETRDLRRKAFAVLRTVVHAHSEEHDDTCFDFGHALVTDVDGGGTNTLYDRAR